jgi:hypothetical protein
MIERPASHPPVRWKKTFYTNTRKIWEKIEICNILVFENKNWVVVVVVDEYEILKIEL